jgi:outer membrane protein OmpA-like peptidoglycan-associated protein
MINNDFWYSAKMKHFIVFFCLAFTHPFSFAQNTIESQHTADYYVKNVLLGQNVVVGKVTQVGQPASFGQFICDSTITGISKGMMLSTGKVNGIFQPNTGSEYTSYGITPDRENPVKGDSELDKLANGKSQDAAIIEFDFVPTKNVIEFKYVFASEEFIEYVGSEFNDVFGFFLSGPGIIGNQNLAVLADGKTPISVNTINHKKNPTLFRENTYENFAINKKDSRITKLYQTLEFDGLTTVLTAQSEVEPFKMYHLKIAIADVADEFLDSGVFLKGSSFSSVEEPDGKYFAQIANYENNEPNIDSLLYGKTTDPEKVSDSYLKDLADNKFKVTNIYFDFNSTELSEEEKTQVEILAIYLRKNQKRCTFIGYTDNVGSQTYNQKLSEDRAKTVIAILVKEGIAVDRLKWSGKSFANPAENNNSEEGRAQNRRVEIVLED